MWANIKAVALMFLATTTIVVVYLALLGLGVFLGWHFAKFVYVLEHAG